MQINLLVNPRQLYIDLQAALWWSVVFEYSVAVYRVINYIIPYRLLMFPHFISGHSLMVNLSRILKSLAVDHSVVVVVREIYNAIMPFY